MTTKGESTKRPWRVDKRASTRIVDDAGATMASCPFACNTFEESADRARLIVKAVNSHDALVEALREIVDAYEDKKLTIEGYFPERLPLAKVFISVRALLKEIGED